MTTVPTPPPLASGPPRRTAAPLEHLLAIVLTLGGLAVAVVLAWRSDGFHQDDDITHYLFALHAWNDVGSLLHAWARPGYNVPTMFVAHFFGLLGCRVLSAAETALTGYLAYLLVRRLVPNAGLVAALAPALVWIQPLALTLSLTSLTETPAALYMTLAAWLYVRGNRLWSCVAFSMLFVTRMETLALAPIMAGAVIIDALRQAHWRIGPALQTWWLAASAAALLWAPVVYVVAAAMTNMGEGSPLDMFSQRYTTEYGQGAWYHFLHNWLIAGGAGVAAMSVVGVVALGRRGWLISALALGLIALQTVLYRYGLFASGGYPRFLVPAAGLFAVLAGAGLAAAFSGRRAIELVIVVALFGIGVYLSDKDFIGLLPASTAGRLVAVAAMLLATGTAAIIRPLRVWLARGIALPALIVAGWQIPPYVRPLSLEGDQYHQMLAQAVWVMKDEHPDNRAISGHVLVYLLRESTMTVANTNDARRKWIRSRPGTLFFWENKYGGTDDPYDPCGTLYAELWHRGKSIYRDSYWDAQVEVFERLNDPDPGEALRRLTTTRTAAESGKRAG